MATGSVDWERIPVAVPWIVQDSVAETAFVTRRNPAACAQKIAGIASVRAVRAMTVLVVAIWMSRNAYATPCLLAVPSRGMKPA